MSDPPCPFCNPDEHRIFHRAEFVYGMWDAYPVTNGHALLITRRHVADWDAANNEERRALIDAVDSVRAHITQRYSPSGFNIGINSGRAAGQTVPHLHMHVIPRYWGDVPDPRGGVRNVIPERANYLLTKDRGPPTPYMAGVHGLDDLPLLEPIGRDLRLAQEVSIAVAFVTELGLAELEPDLTDLLRRGGRLRMLTGDYLGVTEPAALRRMLDWAAAYSDEERGEPHIDFRVFETNERTGFHPKLYLIQQPKRRFIAYVGSSNLTRHALTGAIEWNQRLSGIGNEPAIAEIKERFDALFRHRRTTPLTHGWINRYAKRRPGERAAPSGVDPETETPRAVPTPHRVQEEALEALRKTRQAGNRAGLVVLATGLGKTWLAAFDSEGFRRVLFVAHRQEILRQAMETFRRIRPDARLGQFGGGRLEADADVLFASVQTLSRPDRLRHFASDHFDYVVIDEFHHAQARTYQRIIDHFDPTFLLGLTATPERTDGGDLLVLCGGNLVYRCDLAEGIRRKLLAPFHYFGVADTIDFANIPWRGGRFDEAALEIHVATERRAAKALQEWRRHAQSRGLGFCISQRHADYMADYFRRHGIRAVAVHAGESSSPRAKSLRDLEDGKIEIIFAVDLFNEGLDVPAIDTVMLLRPTESRIVWLQQFGRGLRTSPLKEHLTVIDHVGNHRTFLRAPASLLALESDAEASLLLALERLQRGDQELPPGCLIEYELEAIEVLKALVRADAGARLEVWYRNFAEMHGRRPTATEAHQSGHDPRSARANHGSWLGMVERLGGLDEAETLAFQDARQFLESLHTTSMTKSYKMLVLLAMLSSDSFPGSISIESLVEGVQRLAWRSPGVRKDFSIDIDDVDALRRLLEDHPIAAWTGGKGTGGVKHFSYADGQFVSLISTREEAALRDLVREICEWRLIAYLDRSRATDS